jgi:hypothetical protein
MPSTAWSRNQPERTWHQHAKVEKALHLGEARLAVRDIEVQYIKAPLPGCDSHPCLRVFTPPLLDLLLVCRASVLPGLYQGPLRRSVDRQDAAAL